MILIAIVFAFPVWIFVTVSLKSPAQVAASALAPPTDPQLSNYVVAWLTGGLGSAMINSVVVGTLSVALLIVLGSLSGYVLSRRTSRVGNAVFVSYLVGLMVPLQLGMIPLYQLMRDANLLGTYTSVIIFHVGHQLPFAVFLYTGFLRVLPHEYEEAAMVDGAGPAVIFVRIVFPLVRPITGTVAILTGVSIWNDFLVPLLYLGGSAQRTLPVAIFAFRGEFGSDWGVIFAGMVIAIVPILVVYVLLQKYIITGFASGVRG